jgi:GH25 family lysozyme M1 (1,4-beta-N-acetylmuramidase)
MRKILVIILLLLSILGGVSVWNYQAILNERPTDGVMGSNYQPLLKDSVTTLFRALDDTLFAGVDISVWQGTVDFEQMLEALEGSGFVIIRAGSVDSVSCVSYKDSRFDYNIQEALDKGLYVGTYWFFKPNCDPIEQADAYASYLVGKTYHIPPVADVEVNGGLSPSTITNRLHLFMDRLYELTGDTGIIYTSPSFANSNLVYQSWMCNIPLWIAHWYVTNPTIPTIWQTCGLNYTFHQTGVFDNPLNGIDYGVESASLDHDNFYSDQTTFEDIYVDDEPTPTPTPTPTPGLSCGDISKITVILSDGIEEYRVVYTSCDEFMENLLK